MDDILDRLRRGEHWPKAAADEIKRLRAALREIANENIGNTAAIAVYTARAALGKEEA